MQKSKMILSITLVVLMALAMTPLNVSAATVTINFTPARVTLENGTIVSVGYTVTIDGTDRAVPVPGGYSETWTTDTVHNVVVPALVTYLGRYYYLWKTTGDDGFTTTGTVDIQFQGLQPGKCKYTFGIDSTAVTADPNYKRAGPKIDVFRGKVIKSPDATLIAMQTEQGDVATGLIRTGDVEKLTGEGYTVTYDAGFHMGHVGFNIRPLATQHHLDGSPRRPDTTIWPLADVAFRHAMFHCYDQEAIVASIYGYTVTPIQSLVPPAQGGWVNPSVPKHPYNPGNPFTSPAGEHSSCGILKAAGYVFVDADSSGTVSSADYWTIGGVKVPTFVFWCPTIESAPTSYEHGNRYVTDLGKIGLGATVDNGQSGFRLEPDELATYMDKVDAAEFDCYMVFWSLGRFPDHLYDMCHSSQICGPEPVNKGKYNKPGINDPGIDADTLAIKTSLDHAAKLQAAYDAQVLLYSENRPNAMGYLQLYSRIYFDGFNEDLRGIVKSPGYGADNGWTDLNIHWAPGSDGEAAHTLGDGRHVINWIEGDAPELLNPCYSSTVYAWDVMEKTLDGFLSVDPYTHEDLTAMSSAMPDIVPVGGHMEITYHIRKDVFWQDGTPYTANDAKFNWEFFKNNKIPRYTTTWMYIDHVDVIDDYTVTVTTNVTSQFLVYDIAGLAAYLPPNVWGSLNGLPLPTILSYEPSKDTNAAGMGPWFGTAMGASTRLFGTGPYVFDYWDPVGQVWEVHQFPGYYEITEDTQAQKTQMFHEVGDVNRDGYVDAYDRGIMGAKFGKFFFDPLYDPNADVNSDGVIDVIDLSLANFHFGDLRENPVP